MLSRREWGDIAERSAAAKHGESNAEYYVWRRRAPSIVAGLAIGAAGYGVYWLWHVTSTALGQVHPPRPGGVPFLFWLLGPALVIGTVVAFRPGRIDRLSTLFVKTVLAVAGWGFFAVALIGYLT